MSNFCGTVIWGPIQKKGAMIKKSGVGNDTIDQVGAVFLASHKAVRGKTVEE